MESKYISVVTTAKFQTVGVFDVTPKDPFWCIQGKPKRRDLMEPMSFIDPMRLGGHPKMSWRFTIDRDRRNAHPGLRSCPFARNLLFRWSSKILSRFVECQKYRQIS
ncbi:hypothetical protein TNCV_4110721 [Trichonephila clavipes]|nr:hypothetical protein TNCV_4110721 [Trichonephila clavipes]